LIGGSVILRRAKQDFVILRETKDLDPSVGLWASLRMTVVVGLEGSELR